MDESVRLFQEEQDRLAKAGGAEHRWISLSILAAGVGAMLYVLAVGEPRLSIAVANGTYSNARVGTLVLANGRMMVNGRWVSYVIESDKVGAYVLPASYVGASDHGFVLRRSSYPLKLRLDRATQPDRLDLMDDISGDSFAFQRNDGG